MDTHAHHSTYRINLLEAGPGGKAKIVRTWLTDAAGAAEALAAEQEDGRAVAVEIEGWEAPFAPSEELAN